MAALGSAVGSMVGSALGVALGVALGAELGAELEVALGVALEVAPGGALVAAFSRGMMVSRKKRSPARRKQLAAMHTGSLRLNKANLLFNGAGIRMGSQLQGFA